MSNITKRFVESAKSLDRDTVFWDDRVPGFGLRVKPSGRKTYVIQYRTQNKRSRRITVGDARIFTPEQARNEAREILRKAKLGGDPSSDAALFPGQRKQLGGWHLRLLPKKERARLLRRAVGRGTIVRLRSILLTSGTTIVGLLPLLLRLEWIPWEIPWIGVELPFSMHWMDSENQDIWQNLALTSVGGLVSSTILILLTMPAMYYAGVRIAWAIAGIAGWIARRWAAGALPPPRPSQVG